MISLTEQNILKQYFQYIEIIEITYKSICCILDIHNSLIFFRWCLFRMNTKRNIESHSASVKQHHAYTHYHSCAAEKTRWETFTPSCVLIVDLPGVYKQDTFHTLHGNSLFTSKFGWMRVDSILRVHLFESSITNLCLTNPWGSKLLCKNQIKKSWP